ncbi:MAG: response regulator [Desulfobacterales bacterium]|jgi:CheY-like chemotaxis protein|nr:response regulator [Desulfobacterales bacterium]
MYRKALVVDSDFFFVEFLSRLLEERGYLVHKAYDGKQGIAGLDAGPFDIMFADLVMPKVNGRQFFHAARRRFNGRCCPLVALSGTMIEHMDALDEIGADYFIAKGPIQKLSGQLNDFIAGIEERPGLPPAEKKILQPGGVFPRRDAMELLVSLGFQQAVVERLGVGVVIVDQDTRIIHANCAALGALGKTLLEVLNIPILTLFPPGRSSQLIDALKETGREAGVPHRAFMASLNGRMLRVVVSALKTATTGRVWLVALEGALG